MKRLITPLLLAAISLAPAFAANQAKPSTTDTSTPSAQKPTTKTKSHGKRHRMKHKPASSSTQPAKK